MAAFKGIWKTFRVCSHLPQFLFHRGFSSTLFVKNLSFSTTESSLSEAFSKFGEVKEVKIIKTKLQRSKGFGYVTFGKSDDALNALKEMNVKFLHGRQLYVDKQPQDGRRGFHRHGSKGKPEPADAT